MKTLAELEAPAAIVPLRTQAAELAGLKALIEQGDEAATGAPARQGQADRT
jgi:hypothetical protein